MEQIFEFFKAIFNTSPQFATIIAVVYIVVKNWPWKKSEKKKKDISCDIDQYMKCQAAGREDVRQHFSILHREIIEIKRMIVQHISQGVHDERDREALVSLTTGGALQERRG